MTRDFPTFSKAVHAQYASMAKSELFQADVGDIFQIYLNAFPEGTNPVFRTNTEHDCSCCKNFIRNLGRVVAIAGDSIVTVWDNYENLPEPYDKVARAMAEYVRQQPIIGVYRTKERQYGAETTVELREDKSTHTWHHFCGRIADRHHDKNPGEVIGRLNSVTGVLRRGLQEIRPADIETVIDLINDKALYRGEEHLPALKQFQALQQKYLKSKNPELFAWQNAHAPAARFRNTVIGTLLVDLAEGKDLEQAVKSFESKVAPTNYKRPKPLITEGMVKQAMKTIQDLDLESALQRRYAKLSDVSVNNVLFVNNSAKSQMKDGLEGLLMNEVSKAPVKIDNPTNIKIDDFVANVLPKVTDMQVLVKTAHAGNFMSLTAPVHADANRLFKWDNNFAWSYDGEVADSLTQAVAAAGGRVDGVLRLSHTWNYDGQNQSLMDLHVFMPGYDEERFGGGKSRVNDYYPNSRRVGWNSRRDHLSGGEQDVDYTNAPGKFAPVENITFPSLSKLPEGKYAFKIHNWSARSPNNSGFKAEIALGGAIYTYHHEGPLKNKEWVTLAEATLRNGKWTIEHHHPLSTDSTEKWGVKTEQLVNVETFMSSPNYWDDNQTGNRHWFFILENCVNPGTVRGIYNEFLKPELETHRKVFEVLGSKTKCQPSDEQLSGVGFSSTRNDSVIVVVKGPNMSRAYNINF